LFYQRRLGGNVPDFVKQAISDCLTNGIRNNDYTSFRSDSNKEGSVQIGANWYFTDTAENEQEALANMADIIGDVAAEVADTGEDTYYYSYEPYQDYEVGESFEETFDMAAEVDLGAFDNEDELINEQLPEDDAEEVVFFEDPDMVG
jgi:rubrerythrin